MLLNPSDSVIEVYPRTKIGIFSVINDQDIHFFAPPAEKHIEPNHNENSAQQKCTASQTQEVLDQAKISGEHLCKEQKDQLQSVLTEYTDVFQTTGSPLGHYSDIKHCIRTGDHCPITISAV